MLDEKICVRCGEKIPAGSEYCPTCGAGRDGKAVNRAETFYMDRAGFGRKPDTLGFTPKLIMIYGVLAVLVGIMALAAYGMVESNWDSMADEDGMYYNMSMAQTQTALLFIGVTVLVSGVTAFVSGLLANKRSLYAVSLALCVVASVAPMFSAIGMNSMIVFGVILLVIGLLMSNRIHVNRDSFTS